MALENGVQTPGSTGRATHLGEPLTCEQIRELPDRAEVVITWCGGNGPHPYRILVDTDGHRRAEGVYNDRLLPFDNDKHLQLSPQHRVTLGWDDATRAWNTQKVPLPDHLLERQEILRGIPQPQWSPLQLRVAAALEDLAGRLPGLSWWTSTSGAMVVHREGLSEALNATAQEMFGGGVVAEPYPGGPRVRWAAMLASPRLPGAGDVDNAVADVLLDVDRRFLELPYETLGGVPAVNQELIYAPIDDAAAAALGQYAQRAMRLARKMSS